MKVYGFIPMRSGSVSIKDKNVKAFNGKPLAQWSIDSLNKSGEVDSVFVGLDDNRYEKLVVNAEVFWRSKSSAKNTSPSIVALKEFCRSINPDSLVVLKQATSPLISPEEIKRGVLAAKDNEGSCIISVSKKHFFAYRDNGDPIEHNPKKRPRRQDWEGLNIENGGFYIARAKDFISHDSVVFSPTVVCQCSSVNIIEIDEKEDWVILEYFQRKEKNKWGL